MSLQFRLRGSIGGVDVDIANAGDGEGALAAVVGDGREVKDVVACGDQVCVCVCVHFSLSPSLPHFLSISRSSSV
jgi:hypothetical protein